ncbi:[LysW]-aminoadipate/[LysW]-glutamate kinase [Picrophilus oshimae]|nr:[LysW]-aminoadipate/[LysW]-glutamate kinase [Picrophilus oshimae]
MQVIKIGGSLVSEILKNNDIINNFDLNGIIVHGGGNYINEFSKKFGMEQRFVTSPQGIRSRYTDKETLEFFIMVMAYINYKICHILENHGIKTVSISGINNRMAEASRKERLVIINERNRKMVIDGGYTGKINKINYDFLKNLVDSGYTPVVSPVAFSVESPLNVDADKMAANIAAALHAERLLIYTNVDGIYINGEKLSKMDIVSLKSMKIGNGMIQKVMAADIAVSSGVREVFIGNPGNIYQGTVVLNEL